MPTRKSVLSRTARGQVLALYQSLRLPVIFRKITFGSQSLHGAQALATNLSLIITSKRQGRDPLELIKTLLIQGLDTPVADLYDPGNLPASDSS